MELAVEAPGVSPNVVGLTHVAMPCGGQATDQLRAVAIGPDAPHEVSAATHSRRPVRHGAYCGMST